MSENSIIHVGGLNTMVDESMIYAAFLPFGEIKSVDYQKDRFSIFLLGNISKI